MKHYLSAVKSYDLETLYQAKVQKPLDGNRKGHQRSFGIQCESIGAMEEDSRPYCVRKENEEVRKLRKKFFTRRKTQFF